MQKPAKAAEKSSSEPWISPRDLLHFTDLAPGDRFCDLILTGGVTSAVAYPGLVAVLASSYRFHAIGGSSSGAGIAAIAAAAEYRRRHGSAEGFRVMLERLQALAEEDRLNRTRLLHLFQPARGHRLLFNLLKRAFAGPGREFAAFGWALLRQFLPIFLGVSVVVVMWICAAAAPTDVCGPVRLSCAGLAAADEHAPDRRPRPQARPLRSLPGRFAEGRSAPPRSQRLRASAPDRLRGPG
jgi:hypothetical protein